MDSTTTKLQDALLQALDGYLSDPSAIGLTCDLEVLATTHVALPVYADMGGALLMR